jgi:predicted DNA binding CopG/RHH family protein
MSKIFPVYGDPDFKYLDDEERELIESIENADWSQIKHDPELARMAVQAARNTPLKNERINIRLQDVTLFKIKDKADHLGLPYQTLISSILHQYANGTLVSKELSHETA